LLFDNLVPDTDRVDDDVLLLHQLCFFDGVVRLPVVRSVREHDQNLRNAWSSACSDEKHPFSDAAKCQRDVGLSTANVHVVESVEQRLQIAVPVEVEDELDVVAELHHADLCEIPVDRKRSCNTFGEADHSNVPVFVQPIVDNDAR